MPKGWTRIFFLSPGNVNWSSSGTIWNFMSLAFLNFLISPKTPSYQNCKTTAATRVMGSILNALNKILKSKLNFIKVVKSHTYPKKVLLTSKTPNSRFLCPKANLEHLFKYHTLGSWKDPNFLRCLIKHEMLTSGCVWSLVLIRRAEMRESWTLNP